MEDFTKVIIKSYYQNVSKQESECGSDYSLENLQR